MNTNIEAIRGWLEQQRESIVADLSGLAAIPSVRGEAVSGMPYGGECDRVLDAALEMFERAGAVIEKTPYYGTADIGQGEKHIGLFAHLDVVPAGEGWTTPPFTPTLREGVLYGRGVTDNKSGAIAALYALRAIRALKLPLHNRVRIFLGIDEECGMSDLEQYVEKNSILPAASLIPDGGFPVSAGEKGICRFWVHTPPLQQVVGARGGEAFNVVLAHGEITLAYTEALYNELTALAREDEKIAVSLTDGRILLQTEGIARHASMPEGSENAFLRAAKLLARCEALALNDRHIFAAAAQLLAEDYGSALGLAAADRCFGKNTATNGIICTNEAGGIAFSFDVRYGTTLSGVQVEAAIAALPQAVGAGWRTELTENSPGFSIPEGSPYLTALCRVYEQVSGQGETKPFYMAGGTYARHLPTAFSIGTFAGYLPAWQHIPYDDNKVHTADEYIIIDQFIEGITLITAMLLACDERLTDEEAV